MATDLINVVQEMANEFTTRLARVETQVASQTLLLHSLLVTHPNPIAALDAFSAAIEKAVDEGQPMTSATDWLRLLREEFPDSK